MAATSDEKTRLMRKPDGGYSSKTRTPPQHHLLPHTTKEIDPRVLSVHDLIPLRQELRELASMAVQLSLRQIVRQAMTLTDSAFLGHVGTKQLAGVSLAATWMGVLSTFVQFSIKAIGTLCSQAYGAGNNKLVGIWLQTAIVFSVVAAIPVIVFYYCIGFFIGITLEDEETVEYGSQFARIMALGLIPQYIYGACSTYFAIQGIIMPATICSALTTIFNVLFNQLFIHGAFGWEGLGFIGSPLATVTSTCLQLTLFLLYTVWWKRYHEKYWDGWSYECLDLKRVKLFLGLAVPMGASSVVNWSSAAVVAAFSGLLGPNIAASQSLLNGVFGLAYMAVNGFSGATEIRMSRYLGKGSAAAAKRVLFIGASIVLSGAVVMLVLVLALRDYVFRIWSNDPTILAMCTSVLSLLLLCILVTFMRFLFTGIMNALSLVHINFWANVAGAWCIYVPLSYLLPITWGWGIDGFWWADTLGEMAKLLILLWGLSRVNWSVAAERAQTSAEVKSLEEGDEGDVDSAEQEKQQLITFENEALVGPASAPMSPLPSPLPLQAARSRAWSLVDLTPAAMRMTAPPSEPPNAQRSVSEF